MQLWIVGKFIKKDKNDHVFWECGGVFSTEKKAVDACHDMRYFVAPINLNEVAPQEKTDFPDCYYPKPQTHFQKPKKEAKE